MEHIYSKESVLERPALYKKTYHARELTEESRADVDHAERSGLVRVHRFGTNIEISFLDIKTSPLVPQVLYHVRRPTHIERVVQEGLTGTIYVQDAARSVEPENISVTNPDMEPALFAIESSQIGQGATIILDPESFGGIPGGISTHS